MYQNDKKADIEVDLRIDQAFRFLKTRFDYDDQKYMKRVVANRLNAKKNMFRLNLVNRAKLMHRNVNNLNGFKFDLIVSNPPYVIRRDIRRLSDDITKYEPRSALDGGNDGLDVIRKIIYKSKNILKSNGTLALEIGNSQYKDVFRMLNKNKFKIKLIVRDYRKNIRCIFSTIL